MNLNLPTPPDRGPLTEADERAIDALICESQKWTPSPPDFAASILHQLASPDRRPIEAIQSSGALLATVNDASRSMNPVTQRPDSRKRQRGWSGIAIAASALALAASLLMIVSKLPAFRFEASQGIAQGAKGVQGGQSQSAGAADKNESLAARSPTGQSGVGTDADSKTDADRVESASDVATALPRRGVPMVRREVGLASSEEADTVPGKTDSLAAGLVSPIESGVSLVQFNEHMASYWERIGVNPASSLADSALADRIEQRFGFRPEVASDQVLLDGVLTTPEDCSELASRLVNRLFRGAPLVAGAREKMIREATVAIYEGSGFDRLLASWIANEAFFDLAVPQRLSQSLASNVLDADVACARCHDSPVDGRLAQHDYWAFASLLAPTARGPLFYEMADGRQKIAEARIPERWFAEGDYENLNQISENRLDGKPRQTQFAESLIGRRTLAGSLANRLWELGFGAPLVPRASDPIAPPRDDSLQKAHAELTDLLIASNFDIRAATRMVVASDAMQRGQSELVASGRWRMADDKAIVTDAMSVRSFAASSPPLRRIGRDNLLSMISTRIGNVPKELKETGALLAQPRINNSSESVGTEKRDKPSVEEQWWGSWIADRELLQESWLHWIKDVDEQRRHVYYAANMSPSKDDAELIRRLTSPAEDVSIAAETANDRLLWVLQKSQ